jgi:ribosomal protein S18 acetylase RimI-like enzyme
MAGLSKRKFPDKNEMMEILIRDGHEKDAPHIAKFQIKMALETERKQLSAEVVLPAVRSVFADPAKGFYLVAEIVDQVVGSLLITYEWSDWRNCNIWYIQSVYVEPEFRARGVFTKLHSRVVQMAKDAGIMFVRLFVEVDNTRAQKTYERLGMKRMPYLMYDMKIQ